MASAAQRLVLTGRRHDPGTSTGRHDIRELGAIFVGGAIGTAARAEVAIALPTARGQWPWATFLVNIIGAFLLGYVTTRLQERLPLSAYRRPLLGTGLCGGLTTFSTMQLELLKLLDGGQIGLAVAYALASAVAGFGAVALATNLVRRARATG
jgi:CrcB protein